MRAAPAGPAILLAAMIALLLVGVGWFIRNENSFPPNSLPWKPVALDAPPDWIAHWQMNQLKGDREQCRAALATASQLRFEPLKDRAIGDRCGFDNVVRADASPVVFTPRVTATCSLQAALYWYQNQLAPHAETHMKARLVRVTQFGTFSCRNVNNEQDGRRSEHASANAIDIATFHFANGRSVSVLRDYGKDTAAGRFLAAARQEACGVFNTVLGPEYNRLHANHFHLDMGRYRICS
ncbi:MAG: extensin family protein [Proteobacteria bacterium]|nr:MAG: extensin family protein [Pseudomonadota bacterium]